MNDPLQRYEAIIAALRKSGNKVTPQRMAVAGVLANSQGHPSVEGIHAQLRADYPTMSLATVYRNIMLIKSLGEVLELGFSDGSSRYDGNTPTPHPHVICVKCKKILDLDLDCLGDMTEEVAGDSGFEILTHRLDFFGICAACTKGG